MKRKKHVKVTPNKKNVRKVRVKRTGKTASGTKRNIKAPHKPAKVSKLDKVGRKTERARDKNTATDSNKAGQARRNEKRIEGNSAAGKPVKAARIRTAEHFASDSQGRRIKQFAPFTNMADPTAPIVKKSVGYKKYYEIKIAPGAKSIDEIKAAIEKNDLSFLDDGLKKNKLFGSPKMPQAVKVVIETKHGKETYYTGGISSTDFIVRKPNVKKLILDRLSEYGSNFHEHKETRDKILEKKAKTSKSIKKVKSETQFVKVFVPKNISMISISFIY